MCLSSLRHRPSSWGTSSDQVRSGKKKHGPVISCNVGLSLVEAGKIRSGQFAQGLVDAVRSENVRLGKVMQITAANSFKVR